MWGGEEATAVQVSQALGPGDPESEIGGGCAGLMGEAEEGERQSRERVRAEDQ